MGQVALTLNGRTYRLACEDGQEPRLRQLADYVESKLHDLVREVGQAGDSRLFLMAALLIADELFDATEPAKDAGIAALRAAVGDTLKPDAPDVAERRKKSAG